MAFLGEKAIIPKYIRVYNYLNETFSTYQASITGGTKLQVARDLPILVRLERVSKEDAFKGTFTITPKVTLDKKPDNAKASEDNGKKSYSLEIAAPNAAGQIIGDWNFTLSQEQQMESPPDDLTVTRSWEKTENNVGIATIRIQTNSRYYVFVELPNNKTNVNNINLQPNEVRDNGKTFLWYNWYDMSKGWTLKFPVEVGGNAEAFYPRIRLQRDVNGWQREASGNNNATSNETPYLALKLNSEKPFPFTWHFHGTRTVVLNETMK